MALFAFRLQAKLVEATELRDLAIAAIKDSKQSCERERTDLAKLETSLSEHRSKLQEQFRQLASPSERSLAPEQVSRREAYLRRLQREISEFEEQIRVQSGYLDAAMALLRIRETTAAGLAASVGAFERLKDQQQRSAKSVQQRKADADNDEAGSQLWIRANRPGDTNEPQS